MCPPERDAASHNETVRREFAKQAQHFGEAGLTLSNEEYLRWMVDVLAPAMLAEGRRLAQEAGLGNISFEEGAAEHLPYADASFDLVATRLSLHHMLDPLPAVGEMARVARPGGVVAIIDLISPDNPALAARYNEIERLRDPSHTRALTLAELKAVLDAVGVALSDTLVRDVEAVVERWMGMTQTPAETRRTIVEALTAELDGGPPTGMRPFRRDGELRFLHTWAILLGVRS